MRLLFLLLLLPAFLVAQDNPFDQLGTLLPTPNTYRTASGAPGPDYWQNQADYKISIELHEKDLRITGEETITYHNNSPNELSYLWLQLDQNRRAKTSDTYLVQGVSLPDSVSSNELAMKALDFDGGFKIDEVTDNNDNALSYFINKTMMRIPLDKKLGSGESYTFHLKYHYNINNRMEIGGRSGYEYFEENDNYLFTIAQFFPRMCVYDDIEGWQNKQFLGRGEFTLPFGDYEVEITVPEDHYVAATGTLQNSDDVLTSEEQDRLSYAKESFEQPVIIVSQQEAEKNEKKKASGTKTWKFKANMVRDFAFASSRKFIWDAMAVKMGDKTVMAMSMYPKEGNPLWEQYSTKAIAHTLKWYSHYTIEYPYPVAWSINAARIGMEYPMICFNFGRTEPDGTYSERTKYRMIGVIIHEVGHNYFPMIINSDERQWTWMDEGLNSYVQFLAEQQWERDYPSRRGEPYKIVDYMSSDPEDMEPIMINSESIKQFGNNAYGKPATALNILRETVVGRENFDFAFKEYSERWAFKHPSPADFFRSIEDASAVDLDWFWRGWFYTTNPCDMAISSVIAKKIDDGDPVANSERAKSARDEIRTITSIRNEKEIEKTYDEQDVTLKDFYSTYDELDITEQDRKNYNKKNSQREDDELDIIEEDSYYYEVAFENVGGLIMPIIFEVTYEDNSTEVIKLPAEIWRKNNNTFTKLIKSNQLITKIELDPFYQTADINRDNNYYPARPVEDRFEVFKEKKEKGQNEMQKAKSIDP